MLLPSFLILLFIPFHSQKPSKPSSKLLSSMVRPHTSQSCYTQGLFFSDNYTAIYESCGLYGSSSLRKYSFPSFDLLQHISLPGSYFGEGIAKCGDFIYQLTWLEQTVIQYHAHNLHFNSLLKLPLKEGWGMCSYKENQLLITDGSNKIYFATCKKEGINIYHSISVVNERNTAIDKLNDLVYAKGYIWANRYYESNVYKIDPKNGRVVHVYSMKVLVDHEKEEDQFMEQRLMRGYVLNGIAYHEEKDVFILTGKEWEFYYEMKLS